MTAKQRLREFGIEIIPDTQVTKAITMMSPQPVNVMLGMGLPVYPEANTMANVNDYATLDGLYSIVRRIAKTAARIQKKVYIVKSDAALKDWQFYKRNQKKWGARELTKEAILRTKALEEAPEGNLLEEFLENPNPEFSASTFYEGVYTFRLLTGNTYIYVPKLEFGVNKGLPAEMWLLPSQFMSLQVSDSYPRRTLAYRLMITNLVVYNKDSVMHLKYFNPLFNYVGNELIGFSPVTAAARVAAAENAETDFAVNSFQNSGISGIISNESVQPDEVGVEQMGKMKSDFYREASGVRNANKLLFQGGKVNYTAVGKSVVDMDLIEKAKMTFKQWCNVFGISDRLFNNDATGSEISVDIVYKDLYTNAVLPECYALDDALNSMISPAFSTDKIKYYISSDLTNITELQDDQKDMATVFATLPMFNPVVTAKYMGIDPAGLEDKWYLKTGYTAQDEMGMVQDLPVVTGGGN